MKKRCFLKLISISLIISLFAGCASVATGGAQKKVKIVFGDPDWDSVRFHNAVAGFIAKTAFNLDTEEMKGTTPTTLLGLKNGDIDVLMEMWTDNIATYKDEIEKGTIKELGVNFDDNKQGFYVPRYVIYGDKSRGIAPMAPDLKSVADLAKYKDLFKDEEQPGKGRIYGALSGWDIDNVMYNKYKYYGLDKDFTYFRPGSDSAMVATFTSAYERGEAIVGYYWEPTWIMGKYDFVLLDDKPYNVTDFKDGKCACPSVRVTICGSNNLLEKAPEFSEFLKKYKTSSALTSKALSHMNETGATYEDTAKWFLKENNSLLDEWLPSDKAAEVRSALAL
ncbi:MAG: ABC transporter substrate-binding protein [Bacillota bacterium]|nr:ABC transporter substrate-binding protein [Bacillota bacterium]